jgi:holo-[acyl-carrier protein] synthase
VEVVADASGAPNIRLSGELADRARERCVERAHVSLSHHEGVAAAVVVLEGM